MSNSEAFVSKCRSAIREIKDPAELQRQLREMVEQDYPVAKPIFSPGERMPMHEFLSRYQEKLCGGVVPQFYSAPVIVMGCNQFGVAIRIEPPSGNGLNGAPAVERLERSEAVEQPAPEAARG